MAIFTPVHQFEIRYTRILNFAQFAAKAVAPFVPLCIDFQVEQENSKNPRYVLFFGTYQIIVQNDRMVLRYEGEMNALIEKGSIVQESFLLLYQKVEEIETFGKATNLLLYNIVVKSNDDEQADESKVDVDQFLDKYVRLTETQKIIDSPSDASIALVKNEGTVQINVTFGPYFGVTDINNRNQILFTNEMLALSKTTGQMCELKFVESDASEVNFAKYKSLVKLGFNYIEKLWP